MPGRKREGGRRGKRLPDVVNAKRGEDHPGDEHERPVERLKVFIVFAMCLRISCGKVYSR